MSSYSLYDSMEVLGDTGGGVHVERVLEAAHVYTAWQLETSQCALGGDSEIQETATSWLKNN